MDHLDLKLLLIISLILGLVCHMITFLKLQNLSKAQIKNSELTRAFLPNPLRK